MSIQGLHHVTAICSDADRTEGYYTDTLGLRLVARSMETATEDRHLYFAAGDGGPGSIVSFIERPGVAPGREGVGGTHHFALLVETRDALLKWKRRLTGQGIAVNGPLDRHYFESIYHRDPDGTVIEIATRGAGWARDEAPDRIGTEHRPPPADMLKGTGIRSGSWRRPGRTSCPRSPRTCGFARCTTLPPSEPTSTGARLFARRAGPPAGEAHVELRHA
jgi:glyoxalase family protein